MKGIVLVVFLFFNHAVRSEPITLNDNLLETVKEAVADYFNATRSHVENPYRADDLNRRFEIVDILTDHPVDSRVENGRIYQCAPYGDDVFSVYVLLEENKPYLLKIVRSSVRWIMMNLWREKTTICLRK